MAENNLPQSLSKFLSEQGFVKPDNVWTRDWTSPVGIITANQVIWVVEPDTGKSIVAVSYDGKTWQSFNNPANIDAINRGLKMPDAGEYEPQLRFQHMLVALLHDPRILVCGKDFARQESDVLDTYLLADGAGIDVLREVCSRDPEFSLRSSDWRSSIRIMDYTGAIKDVTVSGRTNPLMVSKFDIVEVMPEHSFYFADEF